jgi:hypothetical protein
MFFLKNRLALHNIEDGHEKCCCILHPLIDLTVQVSISIYYLAAADDDALLCRSHVVGGLQTREFFFPATVAYTTDITNKYHSA